jgi:hypothetical protein
MANLPVPTPASEVPGNFITAALWNANVYNGLTYLLNPPTFTGHQATGQALNTSSGVAIAIDTEDIDTYSGHSNTTNSSRYTAQVAGYYLVWGAVSAAGTTSENGIFMWVAKNGVEVTGSRAVAPYNSSHNYNSPTVPVFVQMNVGDYVELFAMAAGAAFSTVTNPASSFSALWVHV